MDTANPLPPPPSEVPTPQLMDRLPEYPSPATFKAVIERALDQNSAITLVADQVARVDTPALQCLLSLKKHQQRHSLKFEIDAPSKAFVGDLALFGVAPDLSPLERP